MLLQFIFINASFSQTNTPYWSEGFTTGAGCDLSTTAPTNAVSYYFNGSNSGGSWWGKNLYSTTGTGGCPFGNAHVRYKNISGVIDSGALVTPVVNNGINEFHFYRGRASRGYTIYVTNDTAAQTTNWTFVHRIPSSNNATCIDTLINVASATAKRLKIVGPPGTDTDIDSIMLTSYTSTTPTMYVQSATWSGSGTLDVNVKVSNFTNIADFQGTLSWNQSVLSYTGYNSINPNIILNNGSFNLTQTSSGKLPFIWFDPTLNGVSVANDATILVLHFTVLNGSLPNATISFTNTPTTLGIDIMSGGNPTPVTNPVFTAGTITFPTITCTPTSSTINQTICSNQTYLFNGQNLNTAGTYLDTLVNVGGCDSLITLNLSVTSAPSITVAQSSTTQSCDTSTVSFSANITNQQYLSITAPTQQIMPIGTAAFGPSIATSPMNFSNIVYVSPANGCTAITNNVAGKVVLIDRGTCTFTLKVANAQAAGAIGVIIANNASSTIPPSLGGTDPSITIPTISVTLADGNLIKSWLLSGSVAGSTYYHPNSYKYIYKNGNDSLITSTSVQTMKVTNNNAIIDVYVLDTASGCQSNIFVSDPIAVKHGTTSSTTQTASGSYVWNGTTYTTSGTYTYTTTGANSCDSVATLNLTITPSCTPTSSTISQTICSNTTYLFNGQNLNTTGIYLDTLVNYGGCDSIITLNLTVNTCASLPELLYYKFNGTGTSVTNYASNPPTGTATASIMGGLSQGGNGQCGGALIGSGVSASTDYLNTGWATSLPSSWTISFWSANITPSTTLFYIFGDGNASSFRCFTNGVAGANNWILRGGLTDVLLSGGATVAPHVNTFVYDATLGNIKAYLDGVLVNTVAQSTVNINGSGPFKVMGYNSNVGAPSGGLLDEFRVYNRALTATEVLGLNNLFTTSSINVTACGTYTSPSGNHTWTSSGTYTDTVASAVGCDSVITINLTVNPIPTVNAGNDTSVCSGQSVVLQGSSNGGTVIDTVYQQNFSGAHGWTLNVSTGVNGADNNFWKVSSNEGGVLPPGCAVSNNGNNTLHVTSVFNPAGGAQYDAGGLCGILFCPQTNMRAESPSFSTVGKNNLTLQFNFISVGNALLDNASVWYNSGSGWSLLSASIKSATCGGGIGQWTAYSTTLPASCNNNPNVKIGINWTNNDDGVGTNPSVAVDNILVTNTSVSSSGPLTYTWNHNVANGVSFVPTVTQTYVVTGTNGNNCSNTDSLLVTVNPPSSTSKTTITACGNYTWSVNNQNYTTSGTYYNSIGCQSDTLILTINQPTTSTTNLTSCSSYTWHGTTYTTSGTYTFTTTGANSCDSVATLNLTINPIVVNLPTTSSFEAGTAMTATFNASYGTAPYTFTTNSNLPTGVTLTNGTLSGTPTITGTFPIIVSVADFAGCNSTSATYNLTITCPSGGSNTNFFDGFESGSYTPTWSLGTGIDSAKVTTTNPATGNYRLEGYGGYSSHLLGLSTTIAASTPSEVSWNIFPTSNVATNYVVIGDSNVTGSNCIAFVYYISGNIRFVNQSSTLNFSATINQWHHVAIKNINWTNKTFDIWIDNALVHSGYLFRGASINYLAKIHLYNFGSGNGIWDDIRVGSQSVTPTGVATPSSQTICSGGSIAPIVLSGAPSGATYNWIRNNSTNLTGIAASDTGNISGSLTNNTLTQQTTDFIITPTYYGGCMGTPYTASVIVNPIVSSTTTIAACASYSWHNNTYTASGVYADTLIGAGSTGCDSIAKLDLTINPLPIVFAGNDTAICIGKSAVLHGSGATSYAWNYFVNNGVPFNPNITRVYTVTGTDGNGCENTDSVLVTVNSLPIVFAGADTSVCAGKSVMLHGGFSSNNTYTWNNGVTNNVAFVPTATQTYTVTGTDNRGCSATDQMTVNVLPLPTVFGGNDTLVCAGTNLSLVPSGAATYVWNTASGSTWTPISGGTSTINVAPTTTQTYVLEGVGLNGCYNFDLVNINVNPLPTSSVDTIGLKSCFDANGNMFTLKGLSSAGNPAWSVISNPNALNITWYTGQNIDSPVIKILGGTGGNVAFRYRVTSNQTPNCGISEKMLTVRVIPIPTVNSLSNLSICNGTPVAAATFTSPQDSAANPVTYTWSNIAPPTGLNGQNVAGNLPSYTAINTSDILVYDAIKVKPTISLNNLVCQGNETLVRTVEVKPLPRAVLNNPQDTIQCNGSSVTLDVQAFVTNQFNWTTTGDNIGLGNTIGLNPIPTFTATNVGSATLKGNFTITPAAVNGCAGVPLSFNVTVKPTPHLTSFPSVDSICSGTSYNYSPTTNISGTNIVWKRVGPNSINDTALGSNSILQTLSTNNALDYKTAQYNFHLTAAGCTNDTAIRVVVKPVPSTPTFTLPNDFCHNTAYINLQADRAPFANEHFIWSTNPDSALFQNEQRAMIKFALGQNIIHLKSEITGSGCQTGTYTDTFNNSPTPFADPYIIKKEYVVNGALNHIVLVCLHNPVHNYHWGRTRASDLREDNQIYAAEKGQELYFKNPNDFNTDSFYYWVKIVTDTEYNCFRQIYYNGPFASKNDDVIVSTTTPTGMKVYPNPAQTNITVELTGNVEDNYQIKILDVIGQSVYSFDMNDKKQQVDIQALPSGYYLISCWHKGIQIATSKLIKN